MALLLFCEVILDKYCIFIIRGGRPQIVNSCLKKSYLWNYFNLHKLTISQRIANFTSNNNEALEFYNYLMRIGNGTEPTFDQYVV